MPLFCSYEFSIAQNTDLPAPTANLQTVPAGSYVIAMDNTLQINGSGDFNLKSYGLLVYLLNNNVPLKWAIKSGKTKDQVDFQGSAELIKPTFSAAATRNYKAGPFIIYASDTTGVSALIDAFYSSNSLTGLTRPRVYRLTSAAAAVDIRYDLQGFRPKVAVLTDGGNQNIHLAYLTAASIPASSYATSAGTDLISNCFTFASEPHNNNTGTAVNNAITAIRDFVNKGGNFLAQCDAVDNYENNILGRFQTTGGLTVSNTGIGTTVNYVNPDLSVSQFEGAYNASFGGSFKNWKIIGSAANNLHNHVTGTGANTDVIGVSVSKHYYAKGGLVIYVGNHSFSTSTLVGINGIRMYMNAFLTPSNTNCPALNMVLPVQLTDFSGSIKENNAVIEWQVNANENVSFFDIEKSIDGLHFEPLQQISPRSTSGQQAYSLSLKHSGRKYYRLKIRDHQQTSQYSKIIELTSQPHQNGKLSVFATSDKKIGVNYFNSNRANAYFLSVYSSTGVLIYSSQLTLRENSNSFSVPISAVQPQLYYLVLADANGERYSAAIRL